MSESPDNQMSELDKQRFAAMVKRLPKYLTLTKNILADGDVPKKSKALLGVGGAYALSPIDLVPGIIPVAGQLDDAYVLLYGLRKSLTSMSPEKADEHLQRIGVSMDEIDDDIELVVSLAKRIAKFLVTTGVKIGRAGRTTFRAARDTIGRWRPQSKTGESST